jgi:peptidoglycan/xylan/chitin deacetylase (PgdA/CDA1 family)
VREISREGHEIANHGLYHGHPNKMGRTELQKLIVENARLLDEVTGEPPVKLFAPPYGEFNNEVLAVAGNLGYRTILWTIDTVDWKRPAPEVIIQRVTERIEPGAIILMHPTAPTVEALSPIIKNLKEQGYSFLPVGKLLREG